MIHKFEESNVKQMASEMVGDGKLPNKYFVFENYEFYVMEKPGRMDWAGDAGFKFAEGESETSLDKPRMFDTYAEAKDYADSVELFEPEIDIKKKIVETNQAHSITIEDRLSGELYMRTKELVFKKDRMGQEYFNDSEETFEDTKYTQEEMEKRGEVFE